MEIIIFCGLAEVGWQRLVGRGWLAEVDWVDRGFNGCSMGVNNYAKQISLD